MSAFHPAPSEAARPNPTHCGRSECGASRRSYTRHNIARNIIILNDRLVIGEPAKLSLDYVGMRGVRGLLPQPSRCRGFTFDSSVARHRCSFLPARPSDAAFSAATSRSNPEIPGSDPIPDERFWGRRSDTTLNLSGTVIPVTSVFHP
jgi:hypothetical protein